MIIAKLAVSFLAVTTSIFAFGPKLTEDFLKPVVVVRYVVPPVKSIDTIIFEASKKHKVPALLIRAIIEVESGGDPHAIRFEPHHVARITWTRDPAQRRKWASSIGLMQVMAWHLQKHMPSTNYAALYDPEVNIDLGSKILSDCMLRHQKSARRDQVRRALVCYNGSEIYPPKVLQALAVDIIDREL